MAGVKDGTKRLVWVKSGGLCAFTECRKDLVASATVADPSILVGELAHIVSQSVTSGPRASALVPGGDRDGVENLILLCPDHHTIIDMQEHTYTVERLVAMKASHEDWIRKRLRLSPTSQAQPDVSEKIHSSLLVVEQLPRKVYAAACDLSEKDARARVRYDEQRGILLPFIVREGKLIAFWPLSRDNGPFRDCINDPQGVEAHAVSEWLRDETLSQWIITLLNFSLGRYAALRGLRFDREHKRYYFEPRLDEFGQRSTREETYRPLNQGVSTKQVAWNPITKSSGKSKRYWVHLAAALRFHAVSPIHWVLSIRPEHRFTTDGLTPLAPKGIGKRSTSRKSRMYNFQILTEVVFWRSFLTRDQPRMILNLGEQSVIVDGRLLSSEVMWPGVTGDSRPFANESVEEDLFSSAAYHDAIKALGTDSELDEFELDDLAALEALGDDETIAEVDPSTNERAN